MKRIKAIDWKFWLSLTLAMCVAYLAFVGYSAVQDGREKDRQINALIQTAEAKDRAAERRDAAAAQERTTAAEAQKALLDYTRALADRQTAILAYLRAHGVELPTRLVREIPPPVVAQQKGSRPRADRPSGRVSSSGTADRPGKSEHAPGHNKKRKTPKGHRR